MSKDVTESDILPTLVINQLYSRQAGQRSGWVKAQRDH